MRQVRRLLPAHQLDSERPPDTHNVRGFFAFSDLRAPPRVPHDEHTTTAAMGRGRMNTTVTTNNGKHFGIVRKGDSILYRTPGYYTEGMALADAKCWLAFHGEKIMATYTLSVQPVSSTFTNLPIKGEYGTKAEAWAAVQRTEYAEPVTVFEDGKSIMTFSWQFKTPDEPHPTLPNTVNRVRDLCKWTRTGWVQTGVQAVGIGRNRFVRTVAV